MNELHLFAGAGGGILGGMLLGHRAVCAVENNPYRRKVLLQRQRDGVLEWFPVWDDVCTFDSMPWRGCVDVVCAGIPCQRVSIGGKGEGFLDQDYYSAFTRIVRDLGPKVLFLENSSLLARRGLHGVLRDISTLGYNAVWGVFSACSVGATHTRERMFIMANANRSHRDWGNCALQMGRFPVQSEASQESQLKRIEWSAEPKIPRVAYGVADRMEQCSAVGDGQVPAVVKLAWETLSQ